MPDLYVSRPKRGEKPIKPELKSFLVKPQDIHFANQRAEEYVLKILRKHWATNLGWIALMPILFFLPLIALFISFPVFDLLPVGYRLVIFIGWYLLLVAFAFERFLTWYFNAGIITNQRVVDIDFYGLLYKEITDAEFDKIQDVTEKQVGAVRAIFDFGCVEIQTAGEKKTIEFEDIPKPREVVKLLQELR